MKFPLRLFFRVHHSFASRGIAHCACRDCERLRRFCGITRIRPQRGLSMSAMRRNAIETTSGRTRSKIDFGLSFLAPKPTSNLEQMAIATIKPHAAIGMRFHHAACV